MTTGFGYIIEGADFSEGSIAFSPSKPLPSALTYQPDYFFLTRKNSDFVAQNFAGDHVPPEYGKEPIIKTETTAGNINLTETFFTSGSRHSGFIYTDVTWNPSQSWLGMVVTEWNPDPLDGQSQKNIVASQDYGSIPIENGGTGWRLVQDSDIGTVAKFTFTLRTSSGQAILGTSPINAVQGQLIAIYFGYNASTDQLFLRVVPDGGSSINVTQKTVINPPTGQGVCLGYDPFLPNPDYLSYAKIAAFAMWVGVDPSNSWVDSDHVLLKSYLSGFGLSVD